MVITSSPGSTQVDTFGSVATQGKRKASQEMEEQDSCLETPGKLLRSYSEYHQEMDLDKLAQLILSTKTELQQKLDMKFEEMNTKFTALQGKL
ncbi:unnamed protein product [Allacma fusca]|uniref:Uncharacterized protein n=1 Tax=Allacma fusca TaxID=39272 RepID=A0A8J2J152_9HEXA|nr:unnamed protein product [Allacma fusca]